MNHKKYITKSILIEDLKTLGLKDSQAVMLHASVKAIGWIVGGPDIVLQSIFEIIGNNGTLVMAISWEDNPYEISSWSEERQKAYLQECPAYDPKKSHADRKERGILAEYLRTWQGAYRSRHPFSYATVGKHAEWLIKDETLNYSNGPESCLAKLCQLKGKILMIGTSFGCLTLLHHAEYLANVPNKKIDRYKMPLLIDGKKVWVDFEDYNTNDGIVDWPTDYFKEVANEFLMTRNITCKKVGLADSYLFDADELNRFAVNWMESNFNK